MQPFLWILAGVVIGWMAGRALQDSGYGPSMHITMGIGGAVVGGFLMNSTGIPGYAGIILSTFVAIACAVLLTRLAAMANGRRVLARQL